ncbi:MAG: PEGA domain-containing protein [Deltaproteobacteria bacterium]|nr:PEGA domain-containing protein [Deltaproteobacteria bacterium]
MRIDLRLRVLTLLLPLFALFASERAEAQPAGCPNAKAQRTQYAVKIDSVPVGAAIFVDGKQCGSLGSTPWTGKLNPGTITVIFEKDGYKPFTKSITVARVRKQQDFSVALEPQPRIEVNANADKNVVGATVTVDGVPAGTVQGPLIILTTAARHLLEIKKENFETISQWIDLTTTASQVLTPVLKEIKKFGSITVDADVPDAEIYIDQNRHPDNTPATIEKVPEGVHVIEVRKNGQSWTKPVTVKEGTPVKIRAELTAGVGVIRVMSDTAGARAFIDSIDKGPVPVDIKDIKAGEHIIQIKAPGFKTHEEIVAVTPGSSKTVKKELDADVPADSGTLKIVSTVPDATAFVDSVAVGTGIEVRKPAGEYLVQVRKPGYKQFEQKVKVESGKPTVITADLKMVGKLRILSNPAGANVMINGFSVGKTPIETDVETGDTILRIEMPGFNAYEETIKVEGGDKTQTISRELAVAGKSESELENEQKGLSSFGARTLPRGRSTVDIDAGYPYFLNARITVGAGRIAKRFGFDATVAIRTMLARTELGLGGRMMLSNNDPFSAGVFSSLFYGSKLFDDSQRSGVTWDVGATASLTALSNVTISGRAYFEFWSDRHCPALDPGMTNGFEGTDPTDTCVGYKARQIDGMDPADFSADDANRVNKLTGVDPNKPEDLYGRDNGARFLLSIAAEIAVQQRWNIYGIIEGAPFQGKDERALFTSLFSGPMATNDFLIYARFGLTYKF